MYIKRLNALELTPHPPFGHLPLKGKAEEPNSRALKICPCFYHFLAVSSFIVTSE